jgi:hypothetical protein
MFRVSEDNEQAWLVREDVSICFERDPKDHFYKCPIEKVDELIVALDKRKKEKAERGDGHMMNAEDLVGNIDEIYGNGAQRSLYTDEQLRRADIAEAMHISMEHCSDQQLKAFIESPSTINCPITFNDVKNLRAIKGPCRVCLEGKPAPNKGSHSSKDPYVPQLAGELLHCDIVFVKGRPRLFAIDHVSGYCSFIVMAGKHYEDLMKAFEELLNAYQSHMKVVKVVSTDAESVLAVCDTYLNSRGVKLHQRIPGEHEKFAERAMRVVRERMRVKLIELPYELPRDLYDCLAAEVVRTMNMLPNSRSHPLSPKSMVRGEQTNMQADLAPPFGSAVLCPVASATHSTEQKNEIGISCGASEGTRGGVKIYLLNHRNPVTRRVLRPLPMNQMIIDHMNEFTHSTLEMKKDPDDDDDDGADMFNYTETLGQDEHPQRSDDYYGGEDVGDKIGVPILGGLSKTLVDIPYNLSEEERGQQKQSTPVKSPEKTSVVETPINLDSVYPDVATPAIPSPSPVKKVRTKQPVFEGEPARRSSRISESKYKLDYDAMNKATKPSVNSINCSSTAKVYQMSLVKALQSEHSTAAKEAAKKELKQLVNLKTWKYLRRPQDATPSVHTRETPCSMFLKPKYDARGVFTLWKARLVDGGHMTDPERYNPHEKTSPTIGLEVVMAMLALAATKKYNVEVFDVPGAYLNANLKDGHFHKMRISKKIAALLVEVDPNARQYVQEDGSILVEIQKSLYGLPEAAQLWYEYLSGALKDGGYRQCPYEPCLFSRGSQNAQQFSLVGIYVDDCIHIYSHERIRNLLYAALRDANLKDLKIEQLTNRSPISFLGLNIERPESQLIGVNQKGYLDNLLEAYEEEINAVPLNRVHTPCSEDIFRPNYSGADAEPIEVTPFLSKLMRTRYLVRTRPDIELACSGLCTRSRAPVRGDMNALNKLLAYLKTTAEYGIAIRNGDLQMQALFDAAFGVHLDRKSHNGHLVFLGSGSTRVPVYWRSTKQKVVATSSTEAELVCVFDGLDFLIWFKRVLVWMGIPQDTVKIWQDNTSTITMSFMGRGSSGSNTRHIDIKYFFIAQFIEDATFAIEHMGRENMLGDFFASPRAGQVFRRMRDLIMGHHP